MKIDTNHILNKVCSTACMMLCYVAFFSCVGIDMYEGESQQPRNIGSIELIYHWPEDMADGERPDSMYALINRSVIKHRIGYVSGSETSAGGCYRFGKVFGDSSFAVSDDDKQPLMATAGDYRVFAFNNNLVSIAEDGSGMNAIADFRFENLEEFLNEELQSEINISDLCLSYVAHDVAEPYGKDWQGKDGNRYSKFVANVPRGLYCAENRFDEATKSYTFNVQNNGKTIVNLYPQKLTQDITISFPVYTEYMDRLSAEDQLYVDSIVAEISGIPQKMMIRNRTLMADTTYKMVFKMDVDKKNTERIELPDFPDKIFLKNECLATISVLGLLPNASGPDKSIGAGILQLCIYTHLENQGVRESRAKYAKINMFNTISEANLVIKVGKDIMQNPGTYPELPISDTLRIENSLAITRDFVLESVNDENSLDSWFGDEDGDGNLDHDHILPDIEVDGEPV